MAEPTPSAAINLAEVTENLRKAIAEIRDVFNDRSFDFGPMKDKKKPQKVKKEGSKKMENLKKRAHETKSKLLKTNYELRKERLTTSIEITKKRMEKRQSLIQKDEERLRMLEEQRSSLSHE